MCALCMSFQMAGLSTKMVNKFELLTGIDCIIGPNVLRVTPIVQNSHSMQQMNINVSITTTPALREQFKLSITANYMLDERRTQ